MPARLFCQTGELAGSSFDIAREATVGRASQNEITLHPNVISGHQARIYYSEEEQCYFVEDLDSRNGTMLDGMLVLEPMRLDKMHVITFANALDFIFLDLDKLPGAAAPAPPRAPSAQPSWQMAPTEAMSAHIAQPSASPAPPAPAPQPAMTIKPPQPPERTPDPAEADKTRIGDAFGAMPKLGGAPPPPAPQQPPPPQPEPLSAASNDADKTRFGDAFGAMPKLGATPPPEPPSSQPSPPPATESVEEANKTRFGDAFGAMPKLGGAPPAPQQPPPQPAPQQPPPPTVSPNDADKTRFGDAFGAMPDLGPSRAPDATPPAQAAPVAVYRLSVNYGDGRQDDFTLRADANTVGRINDADITLADGSISRQHAVITVREGKVFIRDEGSKNGTFINRQRLATEVEIKPGSTVLFGHQIQATLHRI